MTNPMYMGELDDTPSFIQTDETKVRNRLVLFSLFISHLNCNWDIFRSRVDLQIQCMSQCMRTHPNQLY